MIIGLYHSLAFHPLKEAISYEGTVRPILENYCITCHSGNVPAAGLSLTTYEAVRYQTEKGSLLQRINNPQNPMPKGGLMPLKERMAIAKWAKNGFPKTASDTVLLTDTNTVENHIIAASIDPVDLTKEGFKFFECMQGHWVGNLNIMGEQYDWFAFDYRPIAPSHIHGIYEGGSMGNILTSFFVANFKGTQTIMARNGGVLNGIYRSSYFVLERVRLGPNKNYFRLVDAIGGANIMYMELEFSNDRLLFTSYTSRFGANGKPRLHMRFEGKRRHPEVAQQVAKALGYPQHNIAKDFSQGLPMPKWETSPITSASYMHTDPSKDLICLGQLAGDPYPLEEIPHLARLTVQIEQNELLKDKKLLVYLSKLPLTDEQGRLLLAYNFIKQEHFDGIFQFPELVANSEQFTFYYLHPGDYYLTVVGDANEDGYISLGDITNASQRITVLPEQHQKINATGIRIQN